MEKSIIGVKICVKYYSIRLHFTSYSNSSEILSQNNKSSLKEPTFVESAIKDLKLNGCIEEVDFIPYCCNPLTVAEKRGKLRLVID